MRTPTAGGVHGDDQVRLSRTHWLRLFSGLVAIFALFQWVGLLSAAIVVRPE